MNKMWFEFWSENSAAMVRESPFMLGLKIITALWVLWLVADMVGKKLWPDGPKEAP